MNLRALIVLVALVGLAACGRDSPQPSPKNEASSPVVSSEGLPSYDSQGVITSLEGQILTLDHDGASAAGLAPGRDRFRVYADTLAEAPINPGTQVSFAFKRTPQGLEIVELRAR